MAKPELNFFSQTVKREKNKGYLMTFSKGDTAPKDEQKTISNILAIPTILAGCWAAMAIPFSMAVANYEGSLDDEFNRSGCQTTEAQGNVQYTFCDDGTIRTKKTHETLFGDFQNSAVYDLKQNAFHSQMVDTELPEIYKERACEAMKESEMTGHSAFKLGCV
tara:strand:- start:665 stop:1153 length:489 start_codon:yes stop_codon:yes gene_type:complete